MYDFQKWLKYIKAQIKPKDLFFSEFSLQIRIPRLILPWIGLVKIWAVWKDFEFMPKISQTTALCFAQAISEFIQKKFRQRA
jgi:hypothetical protein